MNQFLESDIDEVCDLMDLENFYGLKILLAGGQGFLGRYFVKIIERINELKNLNIKLTVVDNSISSNLTHQKNSFSNNVTLINGNIIDENFVKSLDDCDIIIHAAGIASPYYYRAKPLETLEVSVNGTKNLLELCKKNKSKLIFFSSSEIYGDPDPKNIPIQESYRGNVSSLGPRACYDESKRLGETLCYVYKHYFNIHTNIIRPFNIYGPGMQEIDYRVMPNFASNIKSSQNLKLYGSAKQTRTYCYITDAMLGFFKVILNGVSGEPYNIGNPNPEISVEDLANIFIKTSNKNINTDIIDYPDSYPADEPMRRCPDINKATQQLNYNPKISLTEGISRFLQWTEKNYEGKNNQV